MCVRRFTLTVDCWSGDLTGRHHLLSYLWHDITAGRSTSTKTSSDVTALQPRRVRRRLWSLSVRVNVSEKSYREVLPSFLHALLQDPAFYSIPHLSLHLVHPSFISPLPNDPPVPKIQALFLTPSTTGSSSVRYGERCLPLEKRLPPSLPPSIINEERRETERRG